jgi:hypothetical protein
LQVSWPEFVDAYVGRNLVFKVVRRLNVPASEPQIGMALVLAAVVMSLMLWAIMWQSNIIVYQRGVIRSLLTARFGG